MGGWAILLLSAIWGIQFYKSGGFALLFGAVSGHYRVA